MHLDTNGSPHPSLSHTAPPNLQPFFDDMPDTESQSNLMSSLKVTPLHPYLLLSPALPVQQRPPQHAGSVSQWLSLLCVKFFSPCFLSSLRHSAPSGKRRCVRLTTGTHCSPLPPLNKTPPSLLSALKYVPQHVFYFHPCCTYQCLLISICIFHFLGVLCELPSASGCTNNTNLQLICCLFSFFPLRLTDLLLLSLLSCFLSCSGYRFKYEISAGRKKNVYHWTSVIRHSCPQFA